MRSDSRFYGRIKHNDIWRINGWISNVILLSITQPKMNFNHSWQIFICNKWLFLIHFISTCSFYCVPSPNQLVISAQSCPNPCQFGYRVRNARIQSTGTYNIDWSLPAFSHSSAQTDTSKTTVILCNPHENEVISFTLEYLFSIEAHHAHTDHQIASTSHVPLAQNQFSSYVRSDESEEFWRKKITPHFVSNFSYKCDVKCCQSNLTHYELHNRPK